MLEIYFALSVLDLFNRLVQGRRSFVALPLAFILPRRWR